MKPGTRSPVRISPRAKVRNYKGQSHKDNYYFKEGQQRETRGQLPEGGAGMGRGGACEF